MWPVDIALSDVIKLKILRRQLKVQDKIQGVIC